MTRCGTQLHPAFMDIDMDMILVDRTSRIWGHVNAAQLTEKLMWTMHTDYSQLFHYGTLLGSVPLICFKNGHHSLQNHSSCGKLRGCFQKILSAALNMISDRVERFEGYMIREARPISCYVV